MKIIKGTIHPAPVNMKIIKGTIHPAPVNMKIIKGTIREILSDHQLKVLHNSQ